MRPPTIRGVDRQDAITKEAARISGEMNQLALDKIMLAQTVQGFTPDQASMVCVVAHAFSLQRLLHFPGLGHAERDALGALAINIMRSDTPETAPPMRRPGGH